MVLTVYIEYWIFLIIFREGNIHNMWCFFILCCCLWHSRKLLQITIIKTIFSIHRKSRLTSFVFCLHASFSYGSLHMKFREKIKCRPEMNLFKFLCFFDIFGLFWIKAYNVILSKTDFYQSVLWNWFAFLAISTYANLSVLFA